MVHSSLTLVKNKNTAIKYKYKLPTQVEFVTLESAIAQLESEVDALEKYAQDLLVQKQQEHTSQEKVIQGIQELETLAHKINALAIQIEAEMLNFTKVAVEVNRCYHILQQHSNAQDIEWNESTLRHPRPLNIWEVHNSSIPIVIKRGTKFILTAKVVNLFPSEQAVDAKTKAIIAQKRRNSLENWLAKQHTLKHK
ncbi:hypothetical protein H6G76_00250 [Nostoc sp. FACHB-152]|uniref:hypothetical protein n=1 Tax=unclassified Nostoc TaxID=2593658 RepID=UPI001685D4B7|nr:MULTISPECIES: hypothetical protein [unclassified Nostoc]MBD2445602.1 hypothetical protein [Nostoc sp. FACHB-152]MBD2466715.1 hypothetical protein [Nostoc sp. FACHB-145]